MDQTVATFKKNKFQEIRVGVREFKGNDLIDIRRVERTLERFGERFVQRVFTEIEREKSERRAARAASYAKRFAAKEACAKALGTGVPRRGVHWTNMGVVHLPSGNGCPLCGDEVGWPNRTAKDRDQLTCQTCDWSGSSDQTVTYSADDAGSDEAGEAVALAGDGDEPVVPPAPLITARLSTVAGGAMLGAAVGLALVLWARRR